MKTFRIMTFLVLGIVLLLALGSGAVMASAPVAPEGAPYIGGQMNVILPDSSLWYRFDYAGNHSQVKVTLQLGALENLAFEVYTPNEITSWWSATPVGAGSTIGDDLVWSSNSHVNGPHYIKVINGNPHAVGFQMMVEGSGVQLGLTPATPPTTTVATTVTTPPGSNTNPDLAVWAPIGGQTAPANTSLWYRFTFSTSADRVAKVILANGDLNGLKLEVYNPEDVSSWWSATPIGIGSSLGDDLVWYGDFHRTGTFYAKVVNDNGWAIPFDLAVQFIKQ